MATGHPARFDRKMKVYGQWLPSTLPHVNFDLSSLGVVAAEHPTWIFISIYICEMRVVATELSYVDSGY